MDLLIACVYFVLYIILIPMIALITATIAVLIGIGILTTLIEPFKKETYVTKLTRYIVHSYRKQSYYPAIRVICYDFSHDIQSVGNDTYDDQRYRTVNRANG